MRENYIKGNKRKETVCEHNHLTREYGRATYYICNLNYHVPRFILIYFTVKEFVDTFTDIKLTLNNEEKYISHFKIINYIRDKSSQM